MSFHPRILRYEVLSSTMDEARRLAALEAAPEGTAVQAASQTAGRGRFGNTWVSPEGNLYMTLILRPKVDTRLCAQLSFVSAVALADTLKQCGVPEASTALKWPNDILVGGEKIAGILLEMQSGQGAAPDFMLVGIGVNVSHAPQGRAYIAGFNPAMDAAAVMDKLLANMAHWYDMWGREGFAPIKARWMEQVYGLNGAVSARMADRTVVGVFQGLDDDGNLLLRDAGGQTTVINSGAVHFVPVKD